MCIKIYFKNTIQKYSDYGIIRVLNIMNSESKVQMTTKNYTIWHKTKIIIEHKESRVHFQIRDVFFCSIGENVGFEQDGRGEEFLRPVVVVKKFNNEVFLGVPLTHTDKKGKYYFSFDLNKEKSVAILSQIRLFDAKRMKYKIGMIAEKDFVVLKEKIRQLLT